MIEPIRKEITVTEERTIGKRMYCDACKNLIADTLDAVNMYDVQYWEVTTGHYDWGNDSCESVETRQYCSRECLKKAFDKYIDETDNLHNSKYFEIQNRIIRSNRR